MTLLPLSQCSRDLDFRPLTPWPAALPVLAWQGTLVVGFHRQDEFALDLKGSPLGELLTACYPRLGLGQLARLIQRLHALSLNAEGFIRLQGLRDTQEFKSLLNSILKLEDAVQDWLDQKQLGARDLALLPSLVIGGHPHALNLLAERNLSRNIAVQIFELRAELLLMSRALPDVPTKSEDPDGRLWLRRLWQSRNPMTATRDQLQQTQIENLPWPNHIKGEWSRQGDERLLEVQLRAHSLLDWQKRLKDLETLSESFKMKSPWTS